VFTAYLAVAVVFSFPLITRFGSWFPSAPENQDVFLFLWNNWWVHHAIVVLHAKPYFTDFIYAPFVTDLRFTSSGLLYGILSIPVFDWLGPVAVLNAQVLATIALNGYATFVLSRRLTGRSDTGFFCGLLIAATPALNFHLASGRPSCAALWPAIFMLHFFLRSLDWPDNRNAAGFGVFAVATLAGDQEAALFGAGWLAILVVYAFVTDARRHLLDGRFLSRFAVVAAIVAMPAYVLYFKPFLTTTGYTTPSATEAVRYSFPASLIWSPRLIWRAYGLVLPFALLAGIRWRRPDATMPWLIGTMLFVILSFGPVIAGTSIPLPFALLRKLPGLEQFRTPYRFQIAAALGMAIVGGLALSALATRLRSRSFRTVVGIAIALAAGDLIWHRFALGFPMQTMTPHAVYETIARDRRDCVVLEIPVGVRTGTDRIGPGEALSFYQPVHQKRLVNGSTSRMPLVALNYYRSSPAIAFLADESPGPGDIAADLRRLIHELHVGYLVVHPQMLSSSRLRAILELLPTVEGLTRLDADADVIAFRAGP
jgi:hypothetical protein